MNNLVEDIVKNAVHKQMVGLYHDIANFLVDQAGTAAMQNMTGPEALKYQAEVLGGVK